MEEDKEHGLSDVEKTALISASFIEEKNVRCPEISNKLAIGMLVPLASEFFRNLGRPGFKPDRHIKTLLTLWMPKLQQARIAPSNSISAILPNRAKGDFACLPTASLVIGFPREKRTRRGPIRSSGLMAPSPHAIPLPSYCRLKVLFGARKTTMDDDRLYERQ